MSLDKHLRKIFDRQLGDLNTRRFRVWEKVHLHILQQESSLNSTDVRVSWFRLNLGFAPLVATLILVILGAGAVNAFNNSRPGDNFYALRRAIEDAQVRLASDSEAKQQVQIAIIEKRVREIIALEAKGDSLTLAEKVEVEEIKNEVGKATIAFLGTIAPKLTTKSGKSELVKNETEATTEIIGSTEALVTVAEVNIVGMAVTQFLISTELTGREKAEKFIEVAKKAQVEGQISADKSGSGLDGTPTGETAPLAPAVGDEAIEPEGSVIQGEVDSKVEIRELE